MSAGAVESRLDRMEAAVTQMAQAMERLAVQEERSNEQRAALSRAFDALSAHSDRIGNLERDIGPVKEVRGWIVKAMLAALGLMGTAIVGLVVALPKLVA